jgi:ABC-type lipoprotein export system ATPase subunit/ABC-type antimicrobial peptide transport system permease subunit
MMKRCPTLPQTALGNLRRKPSRTISLVVSIGLLTAFLIFSISVSVRMSLGIDRILQQMGGDIMVVPVGTVSDPDDFLLGSQSITLRMERRILETLAEMVGVDQATSHTYLTTLPGICCDVSQARIIAFDPDTDFVISPWLRKSLKRDLLPGEVVTGAGVEMGFELPDTDGQARILGKKFVVVGQLDPTGTPLDDTIYICESDVLDVMEKKHTELQVKPDEVSVIFLSLQKGFDIDTIAKTIEREFLQVKTISRGKISVRLKSFFEAASKIFAFTVTLASVLVLLVVGSVFSAVVNERRREIGMIRALGATNRHVLRLFLLEAFFTGAIGSIAGLAVGTGFGMLMKTSIDTITKFPITFSPFQVVAIDLVGMGAGAAICMLGALYPVVRVNRLDPLDAIRGSDAISRGSTERTVGGRPARAPVEKVMVTTEKLRKNYGDGDLSIAAVEETDFSIKRGEFVAILGHPGAGKTTLLSLIGGLTKPSSGEVTLDGISLSGLDDEALAALRNRKIGFIFQFASLIPTLTVLENVLFPVAFSSGEGDKTDDLIQSAGEELLRLVGLTDKLHAYPSQLSGGQQRRVAIARAFIMTPDIILADEPTGDLDVDTEREIMDLFHKMHESGATIAMVTHAREITGFTDRVVEMKKGRII